jgi:ferredoxin
MIALFGHRHVHVDHASACKGCRKCVKACQQGAIQPRADARRIKDKRQSSVAAISTVKDAPLAH